MVLENELIYITLSYGDKAKTVSSGFVRAENSDSKSSSIINLSFIPDQFIYSALLWPKQ